MLANSEDDDMFSTMEEGGSRELETDETYYPIHKDRGWIRCELVVCNMDYFMYLETADSNIGSSGRKKRCLLSAKQLDDNAFLISTDELFPSAVNEQNRRVGYCSTALRQRDSSFLVALNNCHLCDGSLGRFTCGRGPDNREIIAKVMHTMRVVNDTTMKCVMANFPYLKPPSLSTRQIHDIIWCPRSLSKSENSTHGSAAAYSGTLRHISNHPNIIRCVNKLPIWNEELKSLTLNFQDDRVKSSSPQNLLLYDERKLFSKKNEPKKNYSSIDAIMNRVVTNSGKDMNAEHAMLQLGKKTNESFILDFRYPISPLQAFGIAITSFASEESPRRTRGDTKEQYTKSRLEHIDESEIDDDSSIFSRSSWGSISTVRSILSTNSHASHASMMSHSSHRSASSHGNRSMSMNKTRRDRDLVAEAKNILES